MAAIWSPSWERVLGSVSIPLQISALRAPAYNPRLQTDIIIRLHAKMQLCFSFILVCFFNFNNVVSPCES